MIMECEKCFFNSNNDKEYIYADCCLSKSFIIPIPLEKDMFGKFIPHKDCPKKGKEDI